MTGQDAQLEEPACTQRSSFLVHRLRILSPPEGSSVFAILNCRQIVLLTCESEDNGYTAGNWFFRHECANTHYGTSSRHGSSNMRGQRPVLYCMQMGVLTPVRRLSSILQTVLLTCVCQDLPLCCRFFLIFMCAKLQNCIAG